MNDFANTESSGLLKNVYDSSDPLETSLKKRREALMSSKGLLDKDSVEENPKPGSK